MEGELFDKSRKWQKIHGIHLYAKKIFSKNFRKGLSEKDGQVKLKNCSNSLDLFNLRLFNSFFPPFRREFKIFISRLHQLVSVCYFPFILIIFSFLEKFPRFIELLRVWGVGWQMVFLIVARKMEKIIWKSGEKFSCPTNIWSEKIFAILISLKAKNVSIAIGSFV